MTDQVPLAAGDGLPQQGAVVAVQKGDFSARQFQSSEATVTGLAGADDRTTQVVLVVVDIAKHKMGRPGRKQTDNVRRADISTMQHGLDIQTFQHPDRFQGVGNVPVRVAHNAKLHLEAAFPDGRDQAPRSV